MRVRLAALGIFGLVAVSATSAVALPFDLDLAPHRAVYVMSLASTRSGSGVSGASGYMTYKFGDSCDGWTTESKTLLTLANMEGGSILTTQDIVTWESKDGLRYRFHVRNTNDGVVDEISGSASLEGEGQAGVAKFTQPEEKTLRLSKGTVFPTAHILWLLETARHGDRLMERVYFDGSSSDESFPVNAVIGKSIAASDASSDANVDRHLLALPSWNMDLAFFSKDIKDPSPDFEVGLRYYQNGIANPMLLSFGDFSIRGTLQKLEALPKPEC